MLPDLGTLAAILHARGLGPLTGYAQVFDRLRFVDGRWKITITTRIGGDLECMGTITGVSPVTADAVSARYRRSGRFVMAFAAQATEETYTSTLTGEHFRLLTGTLGHTPDCDHRIGPRLCW